MRLDKYISESLGLSRKEARAVIAKGRVQLDGVPCRKADTALPDGARVTADGQLLGTPGPVYLMLHKPAGVLSASRDKTAPTVADFVAQAYPRRGLFPAGRLDKDSTGFILLTDDGALAHSLLAPRRHVEKEYRVQLDGPVTPAMVAAFAQGVQLADGETMRPARLEPDAADPCTATVVLQQGVYHQIKRMFGVLGLGVNALHRTAIGGVQLDAALAPGQWRALTAQELETLRRAANKPEN